MSKVSAETGHMMCTHRWEVSLREDTTFPERRKEDSLDKFGGRRKGS